jgi:hypothetical protein
LLSTQDPPVKQLQRRNTTALSMKSDFIFSFKTVDEDEEEIVYSNTEAGSKSSQYFFKTAGDFLIKPSNTVLYQGIIL